jgi:hypothetical protein
MKRLLLSALLMTGLSSAFAQELEIKDDKVLLDGKAILKYEKINSRQHSFYTLDGENELMMYKWNDNESPQYLEDDFFSLNFLVEKVKVESNQSRSQTISGVGMNSRKNMEKLVKWLLKEKVLNTDGSLNPTKVQVFYDKYNENITQRTVRY